MSRKKKLLLNTGTGILKQVVATICGFILPRFLLLYYGSEVNGLVSSITHFLSFISLLDMGVGAVIQSNLYAPLANKDNEQVSKVVIAAKKFFRRIAIIFIGYIVVLVFVMPTTIDSSFEFGFTASLVVIIAISTFAQYYFGLPYELLLNADQRAYVQLSMQIGTIILNTIASVVLMSAGYTIHIVKLATAVIYLLRPFIQYLYVCKRFKLDKHIKLIEDPIKQKWNGFSQHLAYVVCQNIDVVLLSFFSTLDKVSVYSVYYMVVSGVTQIVMTAATGVESFFGNLLAKNEKNKLQEAFETIEWITHFGVVVIFTIAAKMLVPFISIYTAGVKDVNYIEPMFGYVLTLAYAFQCLRIPYFRMIKAAGHFKQTQNGAFISVGLNIVISVSLVWKYDLIGIALGTVVAMLYHTCYFVWYLKSNILNRPISCFMKYILIDSIVVILTLLLTSRVELLEATYTAWIFMAIKVGLMTSAICILIHIVMKGKQIKRIVNGFKKTA